MKPTAPPMPTKMSGAGGPKSGPLILSPSVSSHPSIATAAYRSALSKVGSSPE